MTGLFSRCCAGAMLALALLALQACVLPVADGKAGQTGAANPILGTAIEVTALPPPPPSLPGATSVATSEPVPVTGQVAGKAAEKTAAKTAAKAADAPAAASATAAPEPDGAKPDAAGSVAEAPVPVPVVKSPLQLSCEKAKGIWTKTAKGMFACIDTTRDGGKSCKTSGQCSGQCLARSGTCAPYKPLFGCNEILDDIGRRMTLCLD